MEQGLHSPGLTIALSAVVGRKLLRDGGHDVVFIDSNPTLARGAEEAGFRVIYGNALEERTLMRARVDQRVGAIAVTENENVNFLFARKARDLSPDISLHLALEPSDDGVTEEMMESIAARPLFGHARRVALWRQRLRARNVRVERWRLEREGTETALDHAPVGTLIPLGAIRAGIGRMIDGDYVPCRGDAVQFAFYPGKHEAAARWLRASGWVREVLRPRRVMPGSPRKEALRSGGSRRRPVVPDR